MTSPATRLRKRSASWAVLGSVAVAAALSVGSSHAQTVAEAASEAVPPPPQSQSAVEGGLDPYFAQRFPNVVLKTHEGRNVRFYDDLLKGKIVLINFMYATCTER